MLDDRSRARGYGPVDDMIGAADDAGLVDGDASVLRWRRAWMAEGMAARCPVGRRRRTNDRWRALNASDRLAVDAQPATTGANWRLSPSEQRVVNVIVDGASTRTAARELHLSEKTVESHLQSVYRKLGVHSRVQLAAFFRSGEADSVANRPDEKC